MSNLSVTATWIIDRYYIYCGRKVVEYFWLLRTPGSARSSSWYGTLEIMESFGK
jgi:hypothetical protein